MDLHRQSEDGSYLVVVGERRYRVSGLSATGLSRLRVTLRVDQNGARHRDIADLYSARSRETLIDALSASFRVDRKAISGEIEALIDALEAERLAMRRGSPVRSEPPVMTPTDRDEALGMLTDSRLIERMRDDYGALGCLGEDSDTMLLAQLCALSRMTAQPVSVLFCARSGAGKSTMQNRICELTPPEHLERFTSITGRALLYEDENALVHKLLVIDEEAGAADAAYAIRSLQSQGHLSVCYTRIDPQTGKNKANRSRVNGPVAIFCTTANPQSFDYETRNRFLVLTVDESRGATRRIVERQMWGRTLEGMLARERIEEIIRRHRNMQRLLEPVRVVTPRELAPLVPQLGDRLIYRREQRKLLTLIDTIALAHQWQRPHKTSGAVEYIEVARSDIDLAAALAFDLLRRNARDLSHPARALLHEMWRLAKGTRRLLKRREIQDETGLSYWHLRSHLRELVEYEFLIVRGKQGSRFAYVVLWDGEEEI